MHVFLKIWQPFFKSYLVLRTAKLGAITKGYAEEGKPSDNFMIICIQRLQKPCTSFCATVPIIFILHEVKQERLWYVFAFNFDHIDERTSGVSQGIGIYILVQPSCTSRLLWRCGRVSDCHPGDPGSIPVRVRSEDTFLHLSHLAPNVKSSYSPVQ